MKNISYEKELEKLQKEIDKQTTIISKAKDKIKEIETKKKDIQMMLLKTSAAKKGISVDELLKRILNETSLNASGKENQQNNNYQ